MNIGRSALVSPHYLNLPQPKPPVFLFMSARSRKLGYAIFRASHVPVFLRFLVNYPPGFIILRLIRSYGEERGGKKQEKRKGRKEKRKEGRNKERAAAGGNSSQKGFVKTAQTYSLPRFAAALCFGFIASFHWGPAVCRSGFPPVSCDSSSSGGDPFQEDDIELDPACKAIML